MGTRGLLRGPHHSGRTALSRRGAGLLTIIAVVGPTASGKSAIAEALAERTGAMIVSVDSMQVYRGMDIGTAKPSKQTRSRIPHAMIDVADPGDEFAVAEFQAMGREAIAKGLSEHGTVVIAGGSGLHFRALVDPMTFAPTDPALRQRLDASDPQVLVEELLDADPEAASLVDTQNPRRVVRAVEVLRLTGATPSERAQSPEGEAVRGYVPMLPFTGFGIDPGEVVAQRVEQRFDRMLDDGLVAEVADLADAVGVTARQAVGYKELLAVVEGSAPLDSARDEAIRATNALAKRQRTFFRRDPRISWLPWQDDEQPSMATVEAIVERTQWTS